MAPQRRRLVAVRARETPELQELATTLTGVSAVRRHADRAQVAGGRAALARGRAGAPRRGDRRSRARMRGMARDAPALPAHRRRRDARGALALGAQGQGGRARARARCPTSRSSRSATTRPTRTCSQRSRDARPRDRRCATCSAGRPARATGSPRPSRCADSCAGCATRAARASRSAPPAFEASSHAPATTRSRLVVMSNRTPPQITGRHARSVVWSRRSSLRCARDGVWLGWSGTRREHEQRARVDDEAQPVRARSISRPASASASTAASATARCGRCFTASRCACAIATRTGAATSRSNNRVRAPRARARHATTAIDLGARLSLAARCARAARERDHRGPIGLFLHIPFPPRDVLDTLPWSTTLIDGDARRSTSSVFTPQQWAENFLAPAGPRHRMRGRMRMPEVGVLPDRRSIRARSAGETSIDREVAGLRAALGQRRLILGVDRLDYSKGIPERLARVRALARALPRVAPPGIASSKSRCRPARRSRTTPSCAPRSRARRSHQRPLRRGRLGAGALPVSLVRSPRCSRSSTGSPTSRS